MPIEKFDEIKHEYTSREITVKWQTAFARGVPLTLPHVAVSGVLNLILRGLPFGDLDALDTVMWVLSSFSFMLLPMLAALILAAVVPLFAFALSCEKKFGAIRKATDSKFQYQMFRCNAVLKTSRFRAITLSPLLVCGVVPYIAALIFGDFVLITAAGILLICFSPYAYTFSMLADTHKDSLIQDHPSLIGGTVYTPVTNIKEK
jgi:hypothetical protein